MDSIWNTRLGLELLRHRFRVIVDGVGVVLELVLWKGLRVGNYWNSALRLVLGFEIIVRVWFTELINFRAKVRVIVMIRWLIILMLGLPLGLVMT